MKYRPHIHLVAIHDDLADAWERHCGKLPNVSVHRGSVFELRADAIVSPANSFGFMDGGIDRLYTQFFGPGVQQDLQQAIFELHHGELLVGAAEIVDTGHEQFPFLIAAPTMRVPQILTASLNPYLAARATLLLAKHGTFRLGQRTGEAVRDHVTSIAIPGLGTGVGAVDPTVCARQVKAAIEEVLLGRGGFPMSTNQARKRHDRMMHGRRK